MDAPKPWIVIAALAATSVFYSACAAQAADLPPSPPTFEPFFVRIGGAAVLSDTKLRAQLGGVPVVGGDGDVATVGAVYVETGYYLSKNFAVSLAGGWPPNFSLKGTGTLASFGTPLQARIGLPVLAATYHLDNFGPFRPYAGVGVGYAIVFDNKAEAVPLNTHPSLASPNLRGAPAVVIVGGIDYDINQHWGVFVDVKKAFFDQRFTGVANIPPNLTLPVSARLRTDPLVVSSGISYRF